MKAARLVPRRPRLLASSRTVLYRREFGSSGGPSSSGGSSSSSSTSKSSSKAPSEEAGGSVEGYTSDGGTRKGELPESLRRLRAYRMGFNPGEIGSSPVESQGSSMSAGPGASSGSSSGRRAEDEKLGESSRPRFESKANPMFDRGPYEKDPPLFVGNLTRNESRSKINRSDVLLAWAIAGFAGYIYVWVIRKRLATGLNDEQIAELEREALEMVKNGQIVLTDNDHLVSHAEKDPAIEQLERFEVAIRHVTG